MAYQKVAGLAVEVEVARHHNTVSQGATVHMAHHGSMAEVVQQTQKWTCFEQLPHHLDCLLAQADD